MNKRALTMQNEMLVKQVSSLSAQIEGYKKRMEEYSLLLAARDFEINRLNGELQSLGENAQEQDIQPENATPKEETPQNTQNVEMPLFVPENTAAESTVQTAAAEGESAPQHAEIPVKINSAQPEIDYKKLDASQLLDNRNQLAADTIAAVTVEAAALNSFLQNSNDENAGELLTLAMGKTEMFKSQVFAAIKGGADGAALVAELNTLKAQTLEYFEKLKLQLR
ncbi:MAG: hypothetical protein KBS41_03875 [Oscillospiraceae bacterium]|nr:hypothetical protein [Candidatus Equicaccousia limihippi]